MKGVKNMAPRTKAVPLTPEQLQMEKDIKRINERINEIAKLYGTESYAYNKWYSAVKSTIPERYRKTSKHGIIQLSRSKEFIQTASSAKTQESMRRLLGLKTVGKLRKEAKAAVKEEGKKLTPENISQFMEMIDKVNKFIEEHSEMFYLEDKRAQDIAHIKTRKKSYKELGELVQIYQQGNATITMKSDPFKDLE